MAKGTIIVTGGTGYIGSHTVVELINDGYDVAIIDNLYNSEEDVVSKIHKITGRFPDFYRVDINDTAGVDHVFGLYSDIVGLIHFAAYKAPAESTRDPFKYYDNNITGSINLLKSCERYGIKNIVFSSSAAIYDIYRNDVPIKEEGILNSLNPYGTSKLVLEYLLGDLSVYKDFNVISLRYFNPIGAHESGLIGENPDMPNNLLPYVFKVANKEFEQVSVFGNNYDTVDGTGVRDYIHVVDLASAHVAAMNNFQKLKDESQLDGGLFEVFNVGTGTGTSVLELIDNVSKTVGFDVPYKIVEERPGDPPKSCADVSKIFQKLGWKSKYTVKKAVEDGWNFIQTQNGN